MYLYTLLRCISLQLLLFFFKIKKSLLYTFQCELPDNSWDVITFIYGNQTNHKRKWGNIGADTYENRYRRTCSVDRNYKTTGDTGGKSWLFVLINNVCWWGWNCWLLFMLIVEVFVFIVRLNCEIRSCTQSADNRASASWSQHSSIVDASPSRPCNKIKYWSPDVTIFQNDSELQIRRNK